MTGQGLGDFYPFEEREDKSPVKEPDKNTLQRLWAAIEEWLRGH